MELWAMAKILESLRPGGKTIRKSLVLQNLRAFVQGFGNPKFFWATLPNILEHVRKRYRNGAAHREPMCRRKAEECRQFVKEKLDEFLSAI